MKFLCCFTMVFITASAHAAPKPLRLSEALSKWVELDPSLEVQKTRVETSEILKSRARWKFAPAISVTGRAQRAGGGSLVGTDSNSRTGWQALGVMDWNLFRFGADQSDLSASALELQSQEASYSSEALQAESVGLNLLVDLIVREFAVQIAQEFVKLREQSNTIARQRYAQGLLALQESKKVTIDLENSRARLADSEIRLAETRATLRARMGEFSVELLWPWKETLSRPENKLQTILKESSRHPKIQSARLSLEAQEHRVAAQTSRIFPTLDMQWTYGRQIGAAVGASSPYNNWTGALVLTVPIFDRLVAYQEMKIQTQARAAAEAKLSGVQYEVLAEQEATRKSIETAILSAQRRSETLALSKTIYQDNLTRFRMGRINADELSVDQDRLLTAQQLEVEGWAAMHRVAARACHSVGRRISECLD